MGAAWGPTVNRWQAIRQLRYRAWAQTWPAATDGTAGERVCAQPFLSGFTAEQLASAVRAGPLVAFGVGDAEVDAGSASLLTLSVPLTLAVMVNNDRAAMASLVGGTGLRKVGATDFGQHSSQGRGLLEVEEVILAAIRQGAGDVGIACQVAQAGAAMVGVADGTQLATCEHRLSLRVTADRYYHAPQRVTLSGGTLSWALPPDRFDRFKIVVRYASGSTAPSGPTAGTPLTPASNLATSVATGLSAGTYSFAVFCAYDETRDVVLGQTLSEAQRYSSQEVGSFVTGAIS